MAGKTINKNREADFITVLSPVQKSLYPSVWFDFHIESHFWSHWRFAVLWKLMGDLRLDKNADFSALDVGCGAGLLRDQLESRTNWKIDGTDLSMEALQKAKRGRGSLYYYDIMDMRPEFYRKYDLVFLFDILEHVADTRTFIQNLLTLVRPGGLVFVNVPAVPWLFGAYDSASGHLRRYDKPSLLREFDIEEAKILDLRYWGMCLLPLLFLRTIFLSEALSPQETIARGFRAPPWPFHSLLKGICMAETRLYKKPFFGTSLLLAVRAMGT